MKNPCKKCIILPKCSTHCNEKEKYDIFINICVFFCVFLFITTTNLLISKFIMPYLYIELGNWAVLMLVPMCIYMTIGLRALFETIKSIREYWVNYGRKKTTG